MVEIRQAGEMEERRVGIVSVGDPAGDRRNDSQIKYLRRASKGDCLGRCAGNPRRGAAFPLSNCRPDRVSRGQGLELSEKERAG